MESESTARNSIASLVSGIINDLDDLVAVELRIAKAEFEEDLGKLQATALIKSALKPTENRIMGQLSEFERKRDSTRAALNEKLNLLEERIRGSIDNARETVKRTVDLQYQVEKRPLVILGCSALAGYFLGRAWFTESPRGESGAENGTGKHEGEAPRNSSIARAGIFKGALTAAVSNLLVVLIKEMLPLGTDGAEKPVDRSRRFHPMPKNSPKNDLTAASL